MTLDDIINLFEECERGVEGQAIGYHLHRPIAQAISQMWMKEPHGGLFSDFLKALKLETGGVTEVDQPDGDEDGRSPKSGSQRAGSSPASGTLVEKAFREGYHCGYQNGGDDCGRFEFGGGSRSTEGQKSDEDSDWEDFANEHWTQGRKGYND